MAVIEGVSVVPMGRQVGPVLATGIEEPAAGAVSETHTHHLVVRGWTVGKRQALEGVTAVADGRRIGRTAVGLPTPELGGRFPKAGPWKAAAGFALTIDTLGLGPDLEIRLRATIGGDPVARIGVIRGRRRPLAPPYEPVLRALLVTSIGRTGTTLLMRMLAAHPAVVAYRRHPYEARAAKYWFHLLKSLARPVDPTVRVGRPNEFHLDPTVAGNPLATAAFAAYPEAARWAGDGYLDDLAAFCLRSIDGWYGQVGLAQGQPNPVYWAEKSFPDGYAALARELYPGGKEIILVRDFRDMWTSMRAYNERRGFGDFGRALVGTDEGWLEELRNGAIRLYETAQKRGEAARIVRYEDLVADPGATLAGLLGYLELDAAPAAVAAMVDAAGAEIPELRDHRTSASVDASLGRWKRDLAPAEQAMVRIAFDDVLPTFGYDPNA
ncbi:MAG: sulfotransferase [Chloroflexia bacterium]|nr:sulfotransferase [Chloroflexia bacterium]